MAALWKRMREYVGQSWVREYGDVGGGAFQAWSSALNEFSEAQIARGVRWCQDWTGDFPPTIGRFRQLCLTVRPEETRNVTEQRIELERREGKSVGMLEHLARHATSDIAKRELDRMRRIVAGEEVETRDESIRNLGLHRRWPSKWVQA